MEPCIRSMGGARDQLLGLCHLVLFFFSLPGQSPGELMHYLRRLRLLVLALASTFTLKFFKSLYFLTIRWIWFIFGIPVMIDVGPKFISAIFCPGL